VSDPIDRGHLVRFGDYANGKFSNSAVYEVERVEHDLEGVSLVINGPLEEPTAKDYPNRHFHINIPTHLLEELAKSHASAQRAKSYYPGHDPSWPEVSK